MSESDPREEKRVVTEEVTETKPVEVEKTEKVETTTETTTESSTSDE